MNILSKIRSLGHPLEEKSWNKILKDDLKKPYFKKIEQKIKNEIDS
jgi:uracil DNA glycosylase